MSTEQIRSKRKVKLPLWLTMYHTMKTYPSLNQAPRREDVAGEWRWVVSFTPRPSYPYGRSPRYPVDRTLGGAQSRSGYGGEEKNDQPPPGIEPYNPNLDSRRVHGATWCSSSHHTPHASILSSHLSSFPSTYHLCFLLYSLIILYTYLY